MNNKVPGPNIVLGILGVLPFNGGSCRCLQSFKCHFRLVSGSLCSQVGGVLERSFKCYCKGVLGYRIHSMLGVFEGFLRGCRSC